MPAIAETVTSDTSHTPPRASDSKSCPICADSLFAAEGSALGNEGEVSYLWSCETCGYGFVTKHTMKAFACN